MLLAPVFHTTVLAVMVKLETMGGFISLHDKRNAISAIVVMEVYGFNNHIYGIKFPFKRNGLPCFENAKTFLCVHTRSY